MLVYGTDSTPKRAIPRGIPRFPVFPTSAVARYIDWSVRFSKIFLFIKSKIIRAIATITKYTKGVATNS